MRHRFGRSQAHKSTLLPEPYSVIAESAVRSPKRILPNFGKILLVVFAIRLHVRVIPMRPIRRTGLSHIGAVNSHRFDVCGVNRGGNNEKRRAVNREVFARTANPILPGARPAFAVNARRRCADRGGISPASATRAGRREHANPEKTDVPQPRPDRPRVPRSHALPKASAHVPIGP